MVRYHMYDIVFDFSSSPTGGALRRLEAYANFFSRSQLKTIFLIHNKAISILNKYNTLDYECIDKNAIEKVLGRNRYLDKYKYTTNWLFSYGIPIENPIGINNWFHISNATPLADFKVSLHFGLRVKMWILAMKIVGARKNCNVVSGESKFSLKLYENIDKSVSALVLENSFDFACENEKYLFPEIIKNKRFALIVGTASYKRLNVAYNVYLNIKSKKKLDALVIIGDISSVNYYEIRNDKSVISLKQLKDSEYFLILKNSSVFISMSEIENSSCAVLEALYYQKNCYLSDIPSHQELLLGSHITTLGGNKCIYIASNDIKRDFKSWDSIIMVMLKKMNFIL